MAEKYPINLWVNEERYDKLNKAGLAGMCKEKLAGLKVIQVFTDDAQKDQVLKLYPMAKFDSSTTKSIELIPKDIKDKIFDLIIQKQSIDIMDEFLKSH
ncbi:MAG: hypothetical protein L0922_08095 [Candidatus Mariimomonas ferrooxydans]